MSCLAQTKKRNHDCQTDCDFRGRDGDDEENKNLRVVIGQSRGIDTET